MSTQYYATMLSSKFTPEKPSGLIRRVDEVTTEFLGADGKWHENLDLLKNFYSDGDLPMVEITEAEALKIVETW